MFATQNVPCYLSGFGGHGGDPENKELKLIFHIIPISHSLAVEISPLLADRLFRKGEEEWEPAKEMPKASFSSIQIQMQNITFRSTPDMPKGVTVDNCAISNLRVSRAYAAGNDFKLEFDCVIPMDGETLRLIKQYYLGTCFLSMEQVQMTLQEQQPDADQQEKQQSLQDAADSADEGEGKKRGRPRKTTTVTMTVH
jgi:hypothetical protein